MESIFFNILLLGDSNVGKTSLIIRFIKGSFEENSSSTVGLQFEDKEIIINDKKIRLHILDTAGQEKYRAIAKTAIKSANGIIFVFDLNNEESIDNIKYWLMSSLEISNDFNKILVGNKCDLIKEKKPDKVKKLIEKYNFKYFEASAKNGTNVELIFNEIAEIILSGLSENDIKEKYIKINEQSTNSKKKKNCCNKK